MSTFIGIFLCTFVLDLCVVFPMHHELIGCWMMFLPMLLSPLHGHDNGKCNFHVSFFVLGVIQLEVHRI